MKDDKRKLHIMQMKAIFTTCFFFLLFMFLYQCATAQDYNRLKWSTEFMTVGDKGETKPFKVKWVYDHEHGTLTFVHVDSVHTATWRYHLIYNERKFNNRLMVMCIDHSDNTHIPVAVILKTEEKSPIYIRDVDKPIEIIIDWMPGKDPAIYHTVSKWEKE